MTKAFFLVTIFALITACSCTSAQTNDAEKMKTTVEQLMAYFEKADTLSILKLHHDYNDAMKGAGHIKEALRRLAEDASVYQKVVQLHPAPKRENFILKKGYEDFPEIEIALLNKDDSTLQLKSCILTVVFYPLKYGITKKIFLYSLIPQPIPKPIKIIEARIPGY